MNKADLTITLGVEEEFFLVDPHSRDMLADPDPGIFEYCQAHAGDHKVVPEMLHSQIETNTRVCHSVAEVREAMRETRTLMLDAAASQGAAVMAASTHPFATWEEQLTTPRKRYEDFEMSYQEAVRRYLVGGMHVHAGFGDQDGSELWWDIRPSQHYPTVELRICDLCTRLDDAMCIIALYACLVRMLMREHYAGELPEEPLTEIIAENRWLAQRYGVLPFLGNTDDGGRTDIADLVTQLVETLSDDARALGCEGELRHALDIVSNGSSADRQTDHYRLRLLEGDTNEQVLVSVVDRILAETRERV